MIDFLQNFQQIQHQYLKSNVFDLLFKCFRNSVFAWFNNQSNFIIIQNFDRNLTCAFSTISLEFIAKSFIFISNSSSQYHSCVECFAHFSSMSRLLKHTQFHCTNSKVICKHCEQNFNFKNKFHEHIREQHIQKSNINSNFRFFTSECLHFSIATFNITSKQTEIATMLITRNFISKRVEIVAFNCSFVSSIFFATFTSISESISLECSHLSIATRNITSKLMKKLSINLFAFSTSFFRTSVRKHQKFHVQKFYFIIDDLIRMFREKFKSFDLRQHQKNFVFSQSFDCKKIYDWMIKWLQTNAMFTRR